MTCGEFDICAKKHKSVRTLEMKYYGKNHSIIDCTHFKFVSLPSLQIFFRKFKLKFWMVCKRNHDLIHQNK